MRGLAASAAGLLLLFACSHAPSTPEAQLSQGAAQMRETIIAAIPDPARRAELLARAERFERVLQRYAGDFREFEQDLQRANAARDTPPAQIRGLFGQFEQKRQAARAELTGLHFEMIGRTSAAEWERIAKSEVKMLQTMGGR
jgi:hypothetical protein